MPVATVWTLEPTPININGYGLDAYGTSPYGAPTEGDQIETTWTEVVQTS